MEYEVKREIIIPISKDIYFGMLRYCHLYHYMHYFIGEILEIQDVNGVPTLVGTIKETTSESVSREIHAILERHRSAKGDFSDEDVEKAFRHYGKKLARRFNAENIGLIDDGVLTTPDIGIIMTTLTDMELVQSMDVGALSQVVVKLQNWEALAPAYANAVWMSAERRMGYLQDIGTFAATVKKYV